MAPRARPAARPRASTSGAAALAVALAVTATLAATAGCVEDEPILPDFRIQLVLDTELEALGCEFSSCEDYGMDCGAWLWTRIYGDDPANPFGRRCVFVPEATDLCAINNATVEPFRDIPQQLVKLEVAIWRGDLDTCPDLPAEGEADGGGPPSSPTLLFDRAGLPSHVLDPQPAFGRSVFVDMREDTSVFVVPLACSAPRELERECGPQTTNVQADVVELDTLLGVTQERAEDLSVRVGQPIPTQINGSTEWTIDGGDTYPLRLFPQNPGLAPFFAEDIEAAFDNDICTLAFDFGAAQTIPTVTCSALSGVPTTIEVTANLIDTPVLDALLDTLSLASVPDRGMLVGRVVDHNGSPLSGVVVTPSAGDAGSVFYLSNDLSSIDQTRTSASGYFVALDVPFNTLWSALHAVDNRIESGSFKGGLIRERVTTLIIEMTPPSGP